MIVREFSLPAFSTIMAPPRSFWIIFVSSFLFSDSPVTIATFPCFRFLCFWIAFTMSTASTVLPEPLRPITRRLPVLEVPSLRALLSLSSTSTICSLIPLTGTKYENSFFCSSVSPAFRPISLVALRSYRPVTTNPVSKGTPLPFAFLIRA